MVQQLQQAMQILKQKEEEIKRVYDLCTANKIEYKVKPKEKK